jgi:hypothetical protein
LHYPGFTASLFCGFFIHPLVQAYGFIWNSLQNLDPYLELA